MRPPGSGGVPEVTRGSQMQDEIADVGAKLGGANGVRGGAGGTAGVATMLAEADLVVFCSAASLQDVVRDRATRYPYASAAQRIFVNTVPGGWRCRAAAARMAS